MGRHLLPALTRFLRRVKCRLWKVILSQHPDGSWLPTPTVAFALEARSSAEVASIKLSLLDRLKDKLTNLGELAEDVMSADDADDVADVVAGGAAQDTSETPRIGRLDSMQPTGRRSTGGDDEAADDPLWCNPAAVCAAMPRRLAALRREDALLELERVWATICCCAWLQTLNCSWLWTDGDLCAFLLACFVALPRADATQPQILKWSAR